MAERVICRNGKCIDLEFADCESEFDSARDISYCLAKREDYLGTI